MSVDTDTILGVADVISGVMNSINDIVKTVTESANERECIRLEGLKLRADIADRITQRENETVCFMKEKEIEMEKLAISKQSQVNLHEENLLHLKQDYDKEIELIRSQRATEHERHEREISKMQMNHEERMLLIQTVKELLQCAYNQSNCYREDRREFGEEYFPVKEVFNVFQAAISQIQGVSNMLISSSSQS